MDPTLSSSPLVMVVVAFFIFIYLGGDASIYEVNAFDYVAMLISIAAFVFTFILIPKTWKLFPISLIFSTFVMLMTFSWVVL